MKRTFQNCLSVSFLIVALLSGPGIFISCSDDDDDQNGPQAEISLTYIPNPVPYDYFDEEYDMFRWQVYTSYFQEHAGVGAHAVAWLREYYTISGQLIDSNNLTSFLAYYPISVSPNGEYSFLYTEGWDDSQQQITDGWYVIDKFTFKDANSNTIALNGTVQFLPVPEDW